MLAGVVEEKIAPDIESGRAGTGKIEETNTSTGSRVTAENDVGIGSGEDGTGNLFPERLCAGVDDAGVGIVIEVDLSDFDEIVVFTGSFDFKSESVAWLEAKTGKFFAGDGEWLVVGCTAHPLVGSGASLMETADTNTSATTTDF